MVAGKCGVVQCLCCWFRMLMMVVKWSNAGWGSWHCKSISYVHMAFDKIIWGCALVILILITFIIVPLLLYFVEWMRSCLKLLFVVLNYGMHCRFEFQVLYWHVLHCNTVLICSWFVSWLTALELTWHCRICGMCGLGFMWLCRAILWCRYFWNAAWLQ